MSYSTASHNYVWNMFARLIDTQHVLKKCQFGYIPIYQELPLVSTREISNLLSNLPSQQVVYCNHQQLHLIVNMEHVCHPIGIFYALGIVEWQDIFRGLGHVCTLFIAPYIRLPYITSFGTCLFLVKTLTQKNYKYYFVQTEFFWTRHSVIRCKSL